MKKPVIEFNNFSFQYRAQAKPTLKNINLTIYEGETASINVRFIPEDTKDSDIVINNINHIVVRYKKPNETKYHFEDINFFN